MFWATMIQVSILAAVFGNESEVTHGERSIRQLIREGEFELNTSADQALEFFTPEGERGWVDGWDPKPIYPPQPAVVFQTNAVFWVEHQGERSLWTILEANADEHIAEYVYVVEGERLSRVRVQIESLSEKRCRVHVGYVHTATSPKGMEFLATVTDEAYARKMQEWRRLVRALIK